METFATARTRILADLTAKGWTVRADLKVPHATSADGRLRLWFKPQALYFTHSSGFPHEFNRAHSLVSDVRGLATDAIIRAAEIRTA